MILTLKRHPTSDGATLSDLLVDGVFQCFTLEPSEDGPHPDIPIGRYRVVINFSSRFKRMLPLVIDVPGRLGIRIHPGNTAEDTEGCILLGTIHAAASVGGSRLACEALQAKIAGALAHDEEVWLTVEPAGAGTMKA